MYDNVDALFVDYKEKPIRLSSIGWIAIIVICAFAILSDIVRIKQVAALGYGLGYRQTNTFLYYADLLFPLAMFLVISIYKNNWKVLSVLLAFIIIRSGTVAFQVGSRSNAVLDIMLSSFAIIKLTNSNDIKKKVYKVVGLIFLAGIVVLPFTGLSRNVDSLTLSDFLHKNNPITYSLTEFGGTIINVRLGIEYMHSLGIETYLSSFLSVVPLSGLLFSSWISTYGGTYSTFLNTVHGGGLGGSIIGEAAFWFGNSFIGYSYIVIMTIVVVFVLNKLEKVRNSFSYIASTTLLFFMYDMFYYIRGAVASLQGGLKIAIYFYLILHFAKKYLFVQSNTE